MMNVGSLPKVVFDLDTQAGVTHLLASIRASDISIAQKNELRDLVFLYTNGGKDQTVRLSLEQKITASNIPPVAMKAAPQPLPPPPTIGKYRVAPSFEVPKPSATIPEAVAKPTFTAAPAWQPPTITPESSTPEPKLDTSPVVEPVRMTDTTPIVAPSISETNNLVAPVAPENPAVSEENQQYLQRIREIKAAVNEKVGNPVNLVDINNEVGREYMGALLDAMKKLNSGSSATSAMRRLEDAFAAVEIALKNHAVQGPGAFMVAPAIARSAAQTAPPPVFPASVPSTPIPPLPVAQPTIPVSIPPVPPPQPVTPISPEPSPYVPPVVNTTPVQEAVSIPVRPVPPPIQPAPATAPTTRLPIQDIPTSPAWGSANAQSAQPVSKPTPVAVPDPAPQPTPITSPVSAVSQFTSLAQVEKPHTIDSLPTSASLKTSSVAGDPLFTQEIDEGLNQLLSEWSIFKKSGLFGTGPKGKEHPLFKKIAPLQIPLLLAGRFEGATQEIKQSITDYMNGWRYEQGLIYQQNETFEHYLRRVIRHILDMQKSR